MGEEIKNNRKSNLRLINSIIREIEKMPMIAKHTDFAIGNTWVNKLVLLEVLNSYK